MNVVFTTALFAGSAAIGCWAAVRFPRLAPSSLVWRAAVPLLLAELLSVAPIRNDSYLGLYCTVFGVLLPLLTVMWLHTVWLLQSLRDTVATR